jgi:tetratricopeptide (TPR) repeat protein
MALSLAVKDPEAQDSKERIVSAPSRKDKIEAMLADDPDDVFLRYSLALEWEKLGDHEQSLRLLRELAQEPTRYVPAYFMQGKQLAKLGRITDARSVLREGIDVARAVRDAHAAAEMSEFLQSLGQQGE